MCARDGLVVCARDGRVVSASPPRRPAARLYACRGTRFKLIDFYLYYDHTQFTLLYAILVLLYLYRSFCFSSPGRASRIALASHYSLCRRAAAPSVVFANSILICRAIRTVFTARCVVAASASLGRIALIEFHYVSNQTSHYFVSLPCVAGLMVPRHASAVFVSV